MMHLAIKKKTALQATMFQMPQDVTPALQNFSTVTWTNRKNWMQNP